MHHNVRVIVIYFNKCNVITIDVHFIDKTLRKRSLIIFLIIFISQSIIYQ